MSWTPSKYNIYTVTTEHGVSQDYQVPTASDARKDFEAAMPGVMIAKIMIKHGSLS